MYVSIEPILVIWNSLEYNAGSGFVKDNGTFVAPIDGLYLFYLQAHPQGFVKMLLKINGSSKELAESAVSDRYSRHKIHSYTPFF